MCFLGTWNLPFPNVGMMSKRSDSVHASKKASLQAVSMEQKPKSIENLFFVFLFFCSVDLLHFSGLVN